MAEVMGRDVPSCESQDSENMNLAPFKMKEKNFFRRGVMSPQKTLATIHPQNATEKIHLYMTTASKIPLESSFLCYRSTFQVLSIAGGLSLALIDQVGC